MRKIKKQIHVKSDKIISFSFDTLARAVYLKYSNDPIARTERKDSSVSIDYDKNDVVVGIEIIRLNKVSATIKQVIKDASKSFSKHVKEEIAPFLNPALAS